MFKKLLSCAIMLSLTAVLAVGLTANAQEGPSPDQPGSGGTISIESATNVQAGSSIELDVSVSGVSSPGITSYQVQLLFDTSVIQLVEVRAGSSPFGMPTVTNSVNDANRTGSLTFGEFISGPNGMTNGKLAGLVFTAIGDPGEASTLDMSIAGNSCQCLTVGDGRFTILDDDLDDDGVPDGEEDDDRDTVDNATEERIGTDPNNPDTDSDGLLDNEEIFIICVDPLRPDTDGDGLADGEEVHVVGSDPCDSDTDDDSIKDGVDECPGAMEDGNLPDPNDGCASAEVGGDPPLYGDIQVFPTPESSAGMDLNSNNSHRDTVLRYKDLSTGNTINTTEVVNGGHANIDIYQNIIVYMSDNNAIKYFDTSTGTAHDTGYTGGHPAIFGDTIVFESAGSIMTFSISKGEITRTGIQGSDPVINNNVIAFHSGNPSTIRYFSVGSTNVRDTGAVGVHAAVEGNIIAFMTNELEASQDLNGDGKLDNTGVIRYYNTTTNTTTTTNAVGDYPMISNGQIAFSTVETRANEDLNGDGTMRGEVIRFFDINSGSIGNTGELGTEPDIYQGQISFYYWEYWSNTDVNGDGDMNDPIIGIVRTAAATTRTTTPAVSTTPPSRNSVGSAIEFDTNGNSRIEDVEFFDAIDAWVNGSVGNDLFFEIVDAWISSSSVSGAELSVSQSASLNVQQNARAMSFEVKGFSASATSVQILDLNGNTVANERSNGNRLVWNMRSDQGQVVANGVYFYVITAEGENGVWQSEVRKIAVLR